MRPRIAIESRPSSLMPSPMSALLIALVAVLAFGPACTLYKSRPPRSLFEATGGEGLENVFWKNIQAANWGELDRALASNYVGVTSAGTVDRSATIEQYRTWQLKSSAIGDLKTEMNGNTIVVTYTITLSGTAGSEPLPSTPQHMMTVWQQQKAGWISIAHSVSQ